MGRVIYVCRIKVLGFSFAVETRELADQWIAEDPDSHVVDELEVRQSI